MKKTITMMVIGIFGLVVSNAQAAILYTNEVDFDIASGGTSLIDNYNDYTAFSVISFQDRGAYTITASNPVVASSSGFLILGFASGGGASATFQFDTAITAFSFNTWYAGNPQSYSLTADSETLGFSITSGSSLSQMFMGVVFNSAVTSFTITDTDTTGNGNFDNLRVATVAVSEPISMVLLSFGVLGLIVKRSRGSFTVV